VTGHSVVSEGPPMAQHPVILGRPISAKLMWSSTVLQFLALRR
jgi:hypothetical protein